MVGGSGSGKSSLTLAGLIAELNTIAIPNQSGTWYVAETRPQRDATKEFINGLAQVVIGFFDNARVRSETPEEGDARIKSLADEFGIQIADARDRNEIATVCRSEVERRLAPEPGKAERRSIDVNALFAFVDDMVDRLDQMASQLQRSGSPCLLIHIDQFEEIFREETDPDGREALLQVLRSIHEYSPPNLFLVATLRSEELHRCSEYEGLSDVINSSMYLVDLVSAEEIERAIVEPARRQASLWALPTTQTRTSPYTLEALGLLKRAYQQAGSTVGHTADQLPLLQHLLPLVWTAAVDDWLGKRDQTPSVAFEITGHHIRSIKGWKARARSSSKEQAHSDLGNCLNAHADEVFKEAIERWRGEAIDWKIANDSPENRYAEAAALVAAFTALALLDDRGRPARRFATLGDMMATIGKPVTRDGLARGLSAFEDAGFIERIGEGSGAQYNVSHEAFIRNWSKYVSWLEEKRFLEQRLRDIDYGLQRKPGQGSGSFLDRVMATRPRDAYSLIPDETGKSLQKIFGASPIYSRSWAAAALPKSGASGRSDETVPLASPGDRLEAVESAWQLAQWWQTHGPKRQAIVSLAAIAVASLAVLLAFLAVFLSRIVEEKTLLAQDLEKKNAENAELAARNEKLGQQLHLALIAQSSSTPSNSRTSVNDREVFAAFKIAETFADNKLEPDIRQRLRETVSQLDKGTRQILGQEISVQSRAKLNRMSRQPKLLLENYQQAHCEITEPGSTEKGIHAQISDSMAVGFWTDDGLMWTPQARPLNALQEPQGIPSAAPLKLDNGYLICLSHDARWLLFWSNFEQSPVLTRITWREHQGVYKVNMSTKFRQARSAEAFARLRSAPFKATFGDITARRDARSRVDQVSSFNNEGAAGFAIKGPEGGILIWTSSGLDDANDAVAAGDKAALPPDTAMSSCQYKRVSAKSGTGGGEINECTIPVPELDGHNHILAISYDPKSCEDPEKCSSSIELRFETDASPDQETIVRAKIPHSYETIKKAGVWNGWLWLQDTAGRQWRYIVSKQRADALLELRWLGVEWKTPDGSGEAEYRPSMSCMQLASCKRMMDASEDDWPGAPSKPGGPKP
ncbi:hypothetical protein QO058_20410 [Bosea vestrisii]|nr:hypothetical protein [Bosea vestrisii]WID95145.1 hypothetical protein QO058_20410 [Bosea vestrisii]